MPKSLKKAVFINVKDGVTSSNLVPGTPIMFLVQIYESKVFKT